MKALKCWGGICAVGYLVSWAYGAVAFVFDAPHHALMFGFKGCILSAALGIPAVAVFMLRSRGLES